MRKKTEYKINDSIIENLPLSNDEIKMLSKSLIAFCVRHNTSLEKYHQEKVPITDERMKNLMIECVNNTYFILQNLLGGNSYNIYKVLEDIDRKYTYDWNEPEIPTWVKELYCKIPKDVT